MANDPLSGVMQEQQGGQQELIKRLLTRVAQPQMKAPQIQPEQIRSMTPQPSQGIQTQGLVRGLFTTIQEHSAKAKQAQLDHATARIKNVFGAIESAYEMATDPSTGQVDEEKAKYLYHQSPEYASLMSKEGQKDMKQMEKLLQYDFLNPEKSKTVWHEALERVAKISGAEKVMKGMRMLMGQHKDKMAEEVRKQGEAQKSQTEAGRLSDTMFKDVKPQQADPSKMLPALISSGGADLRQQQRLMFQDYERQRKEEFTKLIDSNPEFNKNPIMREVGKGINAALEGDDEGANKHFSLASKGAAVQKPGTMNRNRAIDDAVNSDDPQKKAAAVRWLDEDQRRQMAVLSQRGLAFGMGRLYNWYNSETGETTAMNGFQAQNAMKNGEQWIMTAPISPQLLLPVQQIIRSMTLPNPATGTSLKDDLVKDMDVFDNASDRAIISRVLRENPAAYNQQLSTLGIWLDQNLSGLLSEGGQKMVQDLKQYAEVFNRSASATGQTRTEMNTMMLLALLPGERTPNKNYGMQQLQASFNYLDGMVQAPLLGGGRLDSKKKPPKADAAKPPDTIVVRPEDMPKPN